jgi:hypothetical protein
MTKQAIALAALAVLAAGCARELDDFRVGPGVDVATWQAQADAWCEATDGACCPAIGIPDGGSDLRAVDVMPAEAPAGTVGWWMPRQDYTSEILIASRVAPERVWRVALHELGHHCGCRRHIATGNVMGTDVWLDGLTITADDVACTRERRD